MILVRGLVDSKMAVIFIKNENNSKKIEKMKLCNYKICGLMFLIFLIYNNLLQERKRVCNDLVLIPIQENILHPKFKKIWIHLRQMIFIHERWFEKRIFPLHDTIFSSIWREINFLGTVFRHFQISCLRFRSKNIYYILDYFWTFCILSFLTKKWYFFQNLEKLMFWPKKKSMENLQKVITSHPFNRFASILTFWKGVDSEKLWIKKIGTKTL
jgi:hypothetical protein